MSSRSDPSRRDLLKALPLAVGALAAVPGCRRGAPYRSGDFRLPDRSAVALFDAPGYDVDFTSIIGRGLRELGLPVRGQSVLLKPNLVEYLPGHAINTHPAVIAGAAVACYREGARSVIVGEAPGHRRDVEYLLQASGLDAHLSDVAVRFVDLNHDDVRLVPLRSHFTGLDEIALPVTLLDADVVISMPKLKTHHWAGMTASMKNLFGVVPGAVYGWPKNVLHAHGIENAILDLTARVRPACAIVDGVIGMEGDGPIMGRPRHVGVIAMGTDPVAVDATCARLIGLEPTRLAYLAQASAFLGHVDASRIDMRGEPLSRYRTSFEVIEAFRSLRTDATPWRTDGHA